MGTGTCLRALSCAGLLVAGAGASAAISISFAGGSANVERIFELRNETPVTGGTSTSLFVQTVDGVSVDLVVSGGAGFGLSSGRVGFEAEFLIDASGSPATGGTFGLIGPMFGGFRFYDLDNDDTILTGFVLEGVGVIVGVGSPLQGGGKGGQPFLAGSLLGPLTAYTVGDAAPAAGIGGFAGDSAFTLTNFAEVFVEGNDPVAFASGSFSGSFIPPAGTGMLSALALGVCATRRRR